MHLPSLHELWHDSQCGKILRNVPFILETKFEKKNLFESLSVEAEACTSPILSSLAVLLTFAPSPSTKPLHPTLGVLEI